MSLPNKARLYAVDAASTLLGVRKFFRSLKDKHKGKPIYVIGNGPSLKASDLDLLKDEITIASNKIYMIFDQTDWRPTYFTCTDGLVWKKVRNLIWDHVDCPVMIRMGNVRSLLELRRTYWYWDLDRWSDRDHDVTPPGFSHDLEKGIYCGDTVTFDNIQIASYMGGNPICLLGCDHYYDQPAGTEGREKIEHLNENNHFCPNYREPGELIHGASIQAMTLSYQQARKGTEEVGQTVYNCTRGGHLEVFIRKNLEDVLAGTKAGP